MDPAERQAFESELQTQALNPLAAAYQNASVAREPAERFVSLGYLHEVILKCLAAQAYGRARALEVVSPKLIAFLRDDFRQPSTGHWAQLLTQSQKLLVQAQDRPARFLDGRLRKKLRDPSMLELDQRITELLGHTQRDKTKVTLAELLQTLIETRNKTRGHGAPRRAFFEDINPLLEASLLVMIQTLQPHLWGEIVHVEEITLQDTNALLQGQRLVGVTRHPWQATFAQANWLQPRRLYLLESTQDSQTLYPLDPLMVWDRRDESVGFFNGYVESKQQIEYLSYTRGVPWHDRSRSYEEAFELPPAQETRSQEAMKTLRLWSSKGVALYPVDFPLVGQNAVFNNLFKFKQAFLSSQADDIAGFFALIGDWGLGKTRIGYELFAQTFNHVEAWLLNPDEFVVPNGEDGRLLKAQLAEGVLPLFVRYSMVCDEELFADNWIARVSTAALQLVAQAKSGYDVPPALLKDLNAALKARGVDLEALGEALAQDDDDASLSAAMDILRAAGIHHLWVVVDEVETPADLKKGLREDERGAIREDYLDMVSIVIKQENYRQAHPYVNFLVLCSTGMRDKIEIGPNRRRTDSVELEPSRIGDVKTYVDSLRERAEALGQGVDYPPGTLEGAFIACNRNFGWLNVMMSSIHESHRLARKGGQTRTAWQLIEEFARTETRARWMFDLSVLDLLRGVKQAPSEMVDRLIFGQLPVSLDEGLDEAQVKALQRVTVPGINGSAFVDLVEVHLDASTLATELVRPEIGFKLSQRGGDLYSYYDSEISVSGLLAALRAFSVGVPEDNFVICQDLNAFTAQLSALYERPNESVLQVAEPLHGIFLKYQVSGRHYLGPSFALLQRMDILLKREAATVAFLQDPHQDAELERYAEEINKSEAKRGAAICQGVARLLDEALVSDASRVAQVKSAPAVTFTSKFQSPRFEGLRVTPQGRVTIAYGRDLEKLAQELGDIVGQEGVHPIIVLLPSGMMLEDWEGLRLLPRVQLCAIPRALTRVEESFLVKYSGRGIVFQPDDILSAKTQSTRGPMVQNWQRDTRIWRKDVEQKGYLLRPLWYSSRISAGDFSRGYREMLVHDWNIDQLAPDVNPAFDAVTYDNVRKACQYNADLAPGQEPLLEVITRSEPYEPEIPPAFGALLQELKSQATLEVLVRRFFFAAPEKKLKAPKQLEQILELLRALGLVTLVKSAYRAVDPQALKDYRQATSTWLSGECQTLLADLGDTFTPETVAKLQKQSSSFAPKDLEAVEHDAAQADFRVLKLGGDAPSESVRALVHQIDEIERRLKIICPPGIYQQTGETFECTTDHIATYEGHISTLSLWHQVHFYHWLRGQYRQRRDQLSHAVSQQLAEAEILKTLDGQPFPIAPLTQPLKAIAEELKASLASGSLSSRGAISLEGYPQSVNTYLFMGQYANAWHRLEALGQYVERAQPTSFWARFQTTRTTWTERLQDYQRAVTAWESLESFVDDAPSPAWQEAKAIRANLEQFRALVEGGLEQVVTAEFNQGASKLIGVLEDEVEAAVKFQTLPDQIDTLRQDVQAELQAIIDQMRLQALSRVLAAKRRSLLTIPALAETYAETKTAYEAFNVQVLQTGRRYFDDAGKETPWDRWVEIYQALREERYTISPEDDTALRELEEMKLIERTVRLR
jgi:hypothetical protein